MERRDQRGDAGWDATLTVWRESIPMDSTAEDSIRASNETYPTNGVAKPRIRNLEPAGESSADFELGEKIGSGGMGVVYAANQTALNREVAVKMLKPSRKGASAAADALIAEAIVTGHLEHPNVVPVYDLGVDAAGNLFYAMKEVQGFPWSQLMAEKSLDENLDILLRVADTVSFAHSRGILHRDLKPNNIMLGEFGEVMVMDWGASCAVGETPQLGAMSAESSLSGTPAYMPPEMARGDLNRQGEASDVYLLGGILYQIVTGYPPRTEKDPVLCISQASENFIEPVERDSELLRLALKAMAAAPADRFSNVRKFQEALRAYRSHSESLVLLENSKENLVRARRERDYDLFNRAIYGFREALQLWKENSEAESLRKEAVLAYARCAFENADFELAQSLLDVADPSQRELLNLIARAIRDRDAHKRRSRQLLVGVRILGVVLLLFFALAFFLIHSQQRRTAEEHREGLVNLIAAYYGEQNYEATVATFWELHDKYGMDALDEEALLDVRVAAAMNPWRGCIETGVVQPLGIVRSADSNHVWVVGKGQLKKIELDSDVGYDPESIVAIHAFNFGKRLPPGQVVETIDVPFKLEGTEAVHQAKDGTFWAGSGSVVYRKTSNAWKPVLDVGRLDYPPLPKEYNIDRAAVEEWMASKGRKLPITGIVLNKAQTHAAVALGSSTVGWFDLENSRCLGWLAVGHGTRFGALLRGGNGAGVELDISPEGTRLAYRSAAQGESMVFSFDLPSMRRTYYVYNRDYPIRTVSFAQTNRYYAVAQNGHLFSPGNEFSDQFQPEKFYLGEDDGNGVRWGRERCDIRDFPYADIRLAAFSPNGNDCCVLAEGGELFVGAGAAVDGIGLGSRIVDRNPVGCLLSDRRLAFLLTAEGSIHIYDMQAYSMGMLPLGGTVSGLCRGGQPENVVVAFEGEDDGKLICSVDSADNGPVRTTPLMALDCTAFCTDPSQHFLAATLGRETQVHDIRTKEVLYRFTINHGDPSRICRFDESGRYFSFGGDWTAGLRVARTDGWEEILSSSSHFMDIVFDHEGGKSTLLCARTDKKLFSYTIPLGRGGALENWVKGTDSAPMAIIPFSDPLSGQRNYWCKFWFQGFRLYDAETGEALEFQNHWKRTGIRQPEFISTDPRVVFPMENGKLQIVLKSDLYPVFDPRVLDFNVEKVVLNTDATRLYLLSEGKLHCMKMPASQ